MSTGYSKLKVSVVNKEKRNVGCSQDFFSWVEPQVHWMLVLWILTLTLNDAGGGSKMILCDFDWLPFLKGSCYGHKNSRLYQ